MLESSLSMQTRCYEVQLSPFSGNEQKVTHGGVESRKCRAGPERKLSSIRHFRFGALRANAKRTASNKLGVRVDNETDLAIRIVEG